MQALRRRWGSIYPRPLLLSLMVMGFLLMVVSAVFGFYLVSLPYRDGFESGDTSWWTGDYGSPHVVASPTRCGNYALACHFQGIAEAVYAAFNPQSHVYGQAYVAISALPQEEGEEVMVLRFSNDTDYGPSITLRSTNGDIHWRLKFRDGPAWQQMDSTEMIPQEGTYVRIQLHLEGGPNGKCEVWVDDTALFSTESRIAVEPSLVTLYEVGVVYANYPVDVYVDCTQIDTHYIPPVTDPESSVDWLTTMRLHLHDIGFVLTLGSAILLFFTSDT